MYHPNFDSGYDLCLGVFSVECNQAKSPVRNNLLRRACCDDDDGNGSDRGCTEKRIMRCQVVAGSERLERDSNFL